jgi:CBS domain containing-hemolysin-like protein
MSDLEIAGDEDEVIEQIDEEIARTTNPRERRVLRICKAFLPALTRALQDERDLGIEPQEELASARSPQELLSLVRRSAEAGTLGRPMAALFQRSLSFGERSADDVLTPRGQVLFVEAGTPVEDVVELSRTSGHSRFPVTGQGGSDDILGVVSLRNGVPLRHSRRSANSNARRTANTASADAATRMVPWPARNPLGCGMAMP